jgi:hypothetical protein
MTSTTPKKSYLLGGIVFCVFPVIVFIVLRIDGTHLPMPWPILFGLFLLYGLRAVVVSLLASGLDSVASWIVDAIAAAGFAAFLFWLAWCEKQGWSGGLPFIPDSWNQTLARALLAAVGLVCALLALRCLRKAINRSKGKQDDAIRHV